MAPPCQGVDSYLRYNFANNKYRRDGQQDGCDRRQQTVDKNGKRLRQGGNNSR